VLDLVSSETVNVVEISNCAVLIERSGKYETMECRNKMPTVVFNKPSALARYKLILPEDGGTKFIFSDEFTTDYDKEIADLSEKHGVDPYLVKAVIKAESNFDPNAVSPKNAQGIMQLIPETANDYGVGDPFDAKDNMEGGVQYLKDLLDYFDGDMSLSLAAYNAGKGAVIKHGFTIPPYPETTDYIAKVLGYYKLLKAKSYALKR
jgi:soluble lytic murein transglycosylase-like protein